MKSMQEIIDGCVFGYNPRYSADEYRIAMATVTAVYGPKGHKHRAEFSAVIDLDYEPLVNDKGLMIKCRPLRGSKFKVLPAVFVDFTHWKDWHGNRHTAASVDSFRFDDYAARITETKANLARYSGYGEYDGDDGEESDAYDATGLDDGVTEIVIQSRLSNLVDESEADIWQRCFEENEAREAEEEYVREEYEAHLQAVADLMRDDPWRYND